MILAVKNKKACFYNNLKEKREIINMFKDKKYKIFPNKNIKEALLYSKQEKITGFIREEDPFDVLCDLKQEKVRLVSFMGKNKETKISTKYFIILNPLYYINSNERITYISPIDMFNPALFKSEIKNCYADFLKEIKEYQNESKISSFRYAIFSYITEYKELIKKYPWEKISTSGLNKYKEKIYFTNIGTEIKFSINKNEKYVYELQQINHFISFRKEDISDIKIENILLEITDNDFLYVIENNNWESE